MTQNKVLCIYHGPGCADGLVAAWAVRRALGDRVEFVAAKYGDDPPGSARNAGSNTLFFFHNDEGSIRGRDILIVDFSFPLPVLRAMAQEAQNVLVLDHHKTAQEDLRDLDAPMTYAEWKEHGSVEGNNPPNLGAIFDLKRSGAGITWDYLHAGTTQQYSKEELASIHDAGHGTYYLSECPECAEACKPITRPRIVDLIEDRDLWKFNFGNETRAFHAVLTSYDISDLPAMFERLDAWNYDSTDAELARHRPTIDELEKILQRESYQNIEILPTGEIIGTKNNWANLLAEGRAILRTNAQAVANAVAATRRTIKIAGHVVPCANVSPSMASDAGHLLCQPEHKEVGGIGWKPVATEFSATYYDGADGRRHFSLRSPEGGADVGMIAKQMAEQFNQLGREAVAARKEGTLFAHQALKKFEAVWAGGGHEHAAGFDAPLGWEGE